MIDLLVIGAGPYGLAAAKAARDKGLETRVLGRHMSFWREHMPADMFLRSGPDWHLDPAYELTLERFLELHGETPDPLPIGLFLAYTDWFTEQAGIVVEDERVVELKSGFEAVLESGETIRARQVVAAPGIARFTHRPEWATVGDHTCDLVDLDELAGARVLIVGGRQSAYEWAALAVEHGAARVDVVHRHPQPRFERVSWRFVDPLIDATLATDGWWRGLPQSERDAIARQFWEVGRLTLEHWLEPRLNGVRVHAGVSEIDAGRFRPDRIVFATGYKAQLANVPYLNGLGIETRDGFPVLDAHMQTSVLGLYIPGFAATQDFGPFFGFVKGAPAAAELIVRNIPGR
ncbi:FAD-dependent oxidoreductase [Solirubrobacter soli]|uniref:FAD-dependent oxidoreductase n=1 Tax=Solirubrobacter soli TaxID=363832 RepID=UPI000421EA7D|nr:FAD-dependent oxidoreductase [Solirubrobacter soli]